MQVDAGSAYVFRRSSSKWAMRFAPSPVPNPLLFGQPFRVPGVPTRTSKWFFQSKLIAPDPGGGDQFGRSVAISGNAVVVGVIFDDHAAGNNAGSAYLFTRQGSTWSFLQKFIPDDSAPNDLLGYTVSIDGTVATAGAYLDDNVRGVDAGCAYVFPVGG